MDFTQLKNAGPDMQLLLQGLGMTQAPNTGMPVPLTPPPVVATAPAPQVKTAPVQPTPVERSGPVGVTTDVPIPIPSPRPEGPVASGGPSAPSALEADNPFDPFGLGTSLRAPNVAATKPPPAAAPPRAVPVQSNLLEILKLGAGGPSAAPVPPLLHKYLGG